jgi:hypothetical protein
MVVIGPVNVNIHNTPNFHQQSQGYFVHAMPQGYPLAGGGYVQVPAMPKMASFDFNPYNFSQLYQYSGINKTGIKNIFNTDLNRKSSNIKIKITIFSFWVE